MRSRDRIFALHCVTKGHNVYRLYWEKRYNINPTSLTEWKIHIVHCDSASNRGNLKVLQRIAPLQVVIDALFIFEDPKNFSMRTVWRNGQNSKFSSQWIAPGSCRNVNWNLFTAILNLLKPSFKIRYRTSLCTLAVAEAVSCGLKQAKIDQAILG